MIQKLRTVTITDESGVDYTDLFADIPLDDYELIGEYAGIRAVDANIPADPFAPRANEVGPLGALLDRWLQSQFQADTRAGWQYIDVYDVHTIAFADHTTEDRMQFINIFGEILNQRRGYRLRVLADTLDLLITFDLEQPR